MVAAGTVVLAGLFPVLAQAQVARWVLGVSTALTMLVAALLGLLPPDLEAAAMWTIGRSRTTCTREQVLKRWASDDPATRCAAAEALKKTWPWVFVARPV